MLDILVHSRRDKRAAKKLFRRLLKRLQYVPRVPIADKLASDDAARRASLPSVAPRRHKGLNNRAENAHHPTRERERQMRRFKSPGHAQRFLAAYGLIIGHCRPRRHRLPPTSPRRFRHLARGCRVAGAARSTGWLGPSTPTNDPSLHRMLRLTIPTYPPPAQQANVGIRPRRKAR